MSVLGLGLFFISDLAPLLKEKLGSDLQSYSWAVEATLCESEHSCFVFLVQFLEKLVKTSPATSQCTVASVLVVRYLERIADHAVYVCESLVYIVEGEQVSLG